MHNVSIRILWPRCDSCTHTSKVNVSGWGWAGHPGCLFAWTSARSALYLFCKSAATNSGESGTEGRSRQRFCILQKKHVEPKYSLQTTDVKDKVISASDHRAHTHTAIFALEEPIIGRALLVFKKTGQQISLTQLLWIIWCKCSTQIVHPDNDISVGLRAQLHQKRNSKKPASEEVYFSASYDHSKNMHVFFHNSSHTRSIISIKALHSPVAVTGSAPTKLYGWLLQLGV